GIGWAGAWHMGAGDADDMKIVSGLSFGNLPISGNSHAGRLNLEAQLHRNLATPLTDGTQDLWVGFLAQRVGGGPQVSLYSASDAALFHIGHSSGTSNSNWVIASVEGNANKVIGSGISFNELTYFVIGISYDL